MAGKQAGVGGLLSSCSISEEPSWVGFVELEVLSRRSNERLGIEQSSAQ